MASKLSIAESSEDLNPAPEGWMWFKPSTGQIFEFTNGAWVEVARVSLADHSHSEHGNVNFTGTVSVSGERGLTGQMTIANHTLTFKEGILVGFS